MSSCVLSSAGKGSEKRREEKRRRDGAVLTDATI
jgi:hypothetical protein